MSASSQPTIECAKFDLCTGKDIIRKAREVLIQTMTTSADKILCKQLGEGLEELERANQILEQLIQKEKKQ